MRSSRAPSTEVVNLNNVCPPPSLEHKAVAPWPITEIKEHLLLEWIGIGSKEGCRFAGAVNALARTTAGASFRQTVAERLDAPISGD
ncbi:hypothetical protein MTO96_010266 [Rhipicephalus appendiculatus]